MKVEIVELEGELGFLLPPPIVSKHDLNIESQLVLLEHSQGVSLSIVIADINVEPK